VAKFWNALQVKGRPAQRYASHSGLQLQGLAPVYKFNNSAKDIHQSLSIYQYFLTKLVLCMHRNCYFSASSQYSDTALGLGDRGFLCGRPIEVLAIDEHKTLLAIISLSTRRNCYLLLPV